MATLGGAVCVRNGDELDFCWRECVSSLLPVCDEVVVCDGESTDGTQEAIRNWAQREPKIKLCIYKWPFPVGDIEFWVKWLNYAREHLSTSWHFQLDADEILSERSYPEVLALKEHALDHSFWCQRYNFWKDHRNLIPHGVALSDKVCRMAPSHIWMPSDGPHPLGAQAIGMARDSGIEIFHYGFLRRREPFFKKEAQLHRMFFDSSDPRLERVEAMPGNWMTEIQNVDWIHRLTPYNDYHPTHAQAWLRARGYDI